MFFVYACYMSGHFICFFPSKYSVTVGKGKAVPLQAWTGSEGSRKLRFPDFVTTAQDGGKVVSLTHRPPLPPRKYSWYSFLLEAESTPDPQCEKSTDTSWDRTSDLPICKHSTLTTVLPRSPFCDSTDCETFSCVFFFHSQITCFKLLS